MPPLGYAAELLADAELCGQLLELQAEVQRAPEETIAGDEVVLRGLSRAEHLNGRRGVALAFQEQRWLVELEGDGKQVAVKAENIEPRQPPLPAGYWECSGGDSDALRALGRVRPPRPREAQYRAVAQVAFRGSRNTTNWVTNFSAQLVASEVGARSGRVHLGYQAAYLSIRESLLSKLQASLAEVAGGPVRPALVLLSGHSLGGALATLAAQDVAAIPGCEVRVVTWGSPRVGDADFARAYGAAAPSTARFVIRADVVPRVPSNPSDPHDDGAVLGSQLRALLRMPHEAVGAADYVHVCASTQLGQGHSGFSHLLDSVAAAGEEGIARATRHFFAEHYFTKYKEELERVLQGAPIDGGDRSAADSDDAARAARALGSVVRGLSGWLAARGGGGAAER